MRRLWRSNARRPLSSTASAKTSRSAPCAYWVTCYTDCYTLQTRVGAQLGSLESRWTELMSNLLQIEVANATLEGEILQLRDREAQLTTDLASS